MTRQEMKTRAKASLGNGIFQNKWMMALLVCLINYLVTGAAGSLIPGIGAVVVTGPLGFAVAYMFLKQARDNEAMNLNDLLAGFTKDFGGTLLIGLMTSLFVALWSILLIVPGIIKSYAYSMAYYIKADHPDYDWRACMNGSQDMMRGHKMELFVLDLSFIGWYIVGAMCMGIGTLWVTPYHNATRAQFYESLRGTPAIEG